MFNEYSELQPGKLAHNQSDNQAFFFYIAAINLECLIN